MRIMLAVLRSLLRNLIRLATNSFPDCRVFMVTGKPFRRALVASFVRLKRPLLALICVDSLIAIVVLVPSSVVTCILSLLRAEINL